MFKEQKRKENAVIYLRANEMHTAKISIQDQEYQQRNASVEETFAHNYYIQTKTEKLSYKFHLNDLTFHHFIFNLRS
jgi:hypothetical protein